MTTTDTHGTMHDVAEPTGTTDTPTAREPIAYTIREAAELCGLSRDAMRGRVERETVRSVLGRDGMRRIPRSELQRAGLLDHARNHDEWPRGTATMDGVGAATHGMEGVGALVAMLHDLQELHAATLERAVVAETRLQLTTGESSAMETAYHAARAEAAAERERADHLAEQLAAIAAQPKRRRWFARKDISGQ